MTRTTDDLQDSQPWRPLGERVTPPAPKPADPGWKQAPGAAPGIETDRDGHLRTNIPLPKG
jgi:hypothetical protein